MLSLIQALRQQGAPAGDVDLVAGAAGDLRAFWRDCGQPLLMMRIAAAAHVEPKISVAIACEATTAVIDYVGPNEPRPQYALDAARLWLAGRLGAETCARAGQLAEEVAQAYREERKGVDKLDRRKFRAAAYAAFAAARTAFAARDAAVTMELDYGPEYTFDDAWSGAKVGCALTAGQVLLDAAEAACSASAVETTIATGSAMAGAAAANDARPLAFAWACRIIREHLSEAAIAEATRGMLE